MMTNSCSGFGVQYDILESKGVCNFGRSNPIEAHVGFFFTGRTSENVQKIFF